MAAHSELLAFLRDCHEADTRDRRGDLSGTSGVLDELGRLVETESLSPPLESLIQLDRLDAGDVTPWSGALPVTLSPEQQKAVQAASTQPLSLLIGPPGTGKSYTLATVALEHVLRGESVLVCAGSSQALRAMEGQLRSLAETAVPLVSGGDREESGRFLSEPPRGGAHTGSTLEGPRRRGAGEPRSSRREDRRAGGDRPAPDRARVRVGESRRGLPSFVSRTASARAAPGLGRAAARPNGHPRERRERIPAPHRASLGGHAPSCRRGAPSPAAARAGGRPRDAAPARDRSPRDGSVPG